VTAVALDGATIAIGGKTILADVSLAIGAAEFVGVLGANGAGKTTLMKAILGLIAPVAGRISVLGEPATRGNPKIGYLPQTRAAPPALRLTAYDFLASSLRGHRWGIPVLSAADRREIQRVIDIVDGGNLALRPLNALSGGERQRLLLAQALIGGPRLLLLDEPLISLDPRQQQVVVDLVRLNQLLPVIDRVLYLGNRQAAIGTVDEVVTPSVMSRLYGAPIDVVRVRGRIFVLSEGHDVEHQPHDLHDLHAQADDAHVRL
jgi:zinc/manganese transport system ATP-binding protein